jgi:hypothetical protein
MAAARREPRGLLILGRHQGNESVEATSMINRLKSIKKICHAPRFPMEDELEG